MLPKSGREATENDGMDPTLDSAPRYSDFTWDPVPFRKPGSVGMGLRMTEGNPDGCGMVTTGYGNERGGSLQPKPNELLPRAPTVTNSVT
jgi:hypothetical protein